MALASSQIYVATYDTPREDRSRLKPGGSMRSRAQDSTSTSRWRFGRSTTNLREPESRSPSVAPQEPLTSTNLPKLERSASKMSLFSLFSRPKVERARGHTEVGLAVPMRPQTPPKPAPPPPQAKSSLRQNPSPPAQQSIRSRSSQMFRPMSMRPIPPPKEFGSWEPPPLFQAFPQSVKHATVQACIFAPEALMRTQSQRRQAEILLERMDSVRDLSVIEENGSEARKMERTHKRLMSNAVLNPPTPELINKIYILVTAGYVLQYAGDGTFDRTPEKLLKLGKDSAAFACDLIPGKHWVLQISSHAQDGGTIGAGPRNSLLSRLRSQNITAKKAATSFLLILESAEEMDSWMTAVRREIDNHGGTRTKDDSERASSSTDDSRDKTSIDATNRRYQVRRDSKMPAKIGSVDTLPQSQYSSPRIVSSDWESNTGDRASSAADSLNGPLHQYVHHRQSDESSSVTSTPVSQDQAQLDQLRGRPRLSFTSIATSASSPETQYTSRDSSPTPQSPHREIFSSAVEAESYRSAMSLKSFHMNPNSGASRRRSMQPLPVTDEVSTPPVSAPVQRQRHSLYGPTSPKMTAVEAPSTQRPMLSFNAPTIRRITSVPESPTVPLAILAGSTRPQSESPTRAPATAVSQPREDSPVRFNSRSHNVPLRREVVSPPPKEAAPLPPAAAQRQSIIGSMPAPVTTSAITYSPPNPEARAQRRVSANPKPFLRPFPVRPQQQHTDQSNLIPRRLSSLTPVSFNPTPSASSFNRSVTAPITSSPGSTNTSQTSHLATLYSSSQTPRATRRPTSVQVRTNNPAPFLLNSRPVRAVASTPSFVPGRRTSNPIVPTLSNLQSSPGIDTLRVQAQTTAQDKGLAPRRSMAAMALPPAMPPPDTPLPPPPLSMAWPHPPPTTALPPTPPTNVHLSGPAPNMPLPAPPPSMPLPPTPPQMAASRGVSEGFPIS